MRGFFNKISVGTVQFGMDGYGILETPRISTKDVGMILRLLYTKGARYLDTAPLYGNSEEILGSVGVSDWNVMSKMLPIDACNALDIKNIEKSVMKSIETLGLDAIDGLFVHEPSNALHENAGHIFDSLNKLKDGGFLKNVGVSVYTPEELLKILERHSVDLVQIPMNVFDQRFENSGVLDLLARSGVKVHVRSVFLQGLLLKEPSDLPTYFKPWAQSFSNFHEFCHEEKIRPLQYILKQALMNSKVDKVILGFDGLQSVTDIVEEIEKIEVETSLQSDFSQSDVNLIEPRRWPSSWQ
jgi:aryl-alcohol dehydrogenase-like predicted oxidoreductase